jgi:site-specific DNA-methyltransferase (adenine-specific)
MRNHVEVADALEYLRDIEDNSVDLVLTDPPYAIDYASWDVFPSEEVYLDWCEQWSSECVRILKPERMLIVWGTLKHDTFLKYILSMSSNPELTRQSEIIWSYNWGGRTKKNFARKHEYAFCWSNGDEFLFNADAVRVERKMKKNPRTGEAFTQGTIPTSVWEKNNHTTSKDFVNWHPTTKNIEVLERMILAYTNEGDTIVDPFAGSGSTALAAQRLNRRCLSCELDSEYAEKANKRLEIG